jgi:hypothetical protein
VLAGLLDVATVTVGAMIVVLVSEQCACWHKKAATGARRAINGLLQTASRHRRRA